MPEQNKRRSADLNLSSVEGDMFGVLFSFHKETMDLLRQSSLDDEKLNLVADRISTLLAGITAELKRTKDLNVAGRLEAAYDEVQRLVDELSGAHGGGKEG